MKYFSRFAVMFAAILLIATSAFPQAAPVGTIKGVVTDATGGVLPGVTVEITSQDKGFSRSTTSDENGNYLFALVPVGPYRIVASLSGFDTLTRSNNVVESQRTTGVDIPMRLGAASAEITVTGEVPIVDRTSPAQNTRFRKEEFDKAPVGRSYQTLFGSAPGVSTVSGGNPTVHGGTSASNQYQFDGVDTTDTTTGTFGANLNFEAIQEVSVVTSGMSAEYGRASGGLVNVITKSGTNKFEGSAKYLMVNDDLNEQNKTKNQVTGASLARVKFDHLNPTESFTLGGPVWKDHGWFFGAWEKSEVISPQQITVDVPENYQANRSATYTNYRLTGQVTPSHNLWAKYTSDPDGGIIRDYWAGGGPLGAVFAGEIEALTAQAQGGSTKSASWSGLWGSKISSELTYGQLDSGITVGFLNQDASVEGGAVHNDLSSGFYYNGPTFVGFVKRPRKSLTGGVSYYGNLFGNTHDFKVGVDVQDLESSSQFAYPANRYYEDESFDPVTRMFVPSIRYDFDPPQPSTSKGDITSFYARDKFEVGKRLFFELGARYENQKGESDIGVSTIESSNISPRLAGTFDLLGNGKSILIGTAGRFYQFLIQDYTDSFANVPQQGAYNVLEWNGTQFVQTDRVDPASNDLRPADLDTAYVDEFTAGFEQQFGNTLGIGLRGIYRKWDNLIDDVITFDAAGKQRRTIVNYGEAERKYSGFELTVDKRFSNRWSGNVNYTYSKTEGNHFASYGTTLGDYDDAICTVPTTGTGAARRSVDPTIGTPSKRTGANPAVNFDIPCSQVQDGANKNGLASYDRPHYIKGFTSYNLPLGPVNLAFGLVANWRSGLSYTPNRTVNVLRPGSNTAVATATYFYKNRGSERLDSVWEADTAIEATFRVWKIFEIGAKGEAFNMFDNQEQVSVNNTVFCGDPSATAAASCLTARQRFGTATGRTAFQSPRSFRLTALIRF